MTEEEDFKLSATLLTCTIKLTRDEGMAIKSLIQEYYPHTFPHYCLKCGISTPNFYSTLNGERPCTLDFLNKILSGIHHEAVIANPEINIVDISQMEIVTPVEELIDEYDTFKE